MKLQRIPPRPAQESIIPLIDVVFFLLVFFMLIGRMDATAPFDVTPASAATGSDMPGGGVTLSISAEGDLAFEGQTIDPAALEVAAQAAIAQNADVLVRVNAHRDALLGDVLPHVSALEALGARDVVLVVTPSSP
tara:strand:+ start:112205 stop:112609 length:405 start_codon:yes stop_codon:yes gene_type:complete